jgi:hypothetical protein
MAARACCGWNDGCEGRAARGPCRGIFEGGSCLRVVRQAASKWACRPPVSVLRDADESHSHTTCLPRPAGSSAPSAPPENMMRSTTVAAAAFALLLLASSAAAGRQLKDVTAAVNLGDAADYVILAGAGVSTVPNSIITGDIGVSPAALSYATGFDLALNPAGTEATSAQVTGLMYAADMKPAAAALTTATTARTTAYNDAFGRTTTSADKLNVGDGVIGGRTFLTGTHTWTSAVTIPSSITISGSNTEVFIFQISKGLTVADNVQVTLDGGAKAENIFWQVAESVEVGKASVFEGIILAATDVTFKTGSSLKGRVLAGTFVALQVATITQP